MREIIFDVETTGLRPKEGDRICEIAAIEMVDYVQTGRTFHHYINPAMPIPAKAESIHGLSDAFLADKPAFESIAEEWIDFIGADRLIAHNAMFDFGFVNAELERCTLPALSFERMVDTLALARRKFPGTENTLDALCNRFGISLAARSKHNALIDTKLLAEVYLELIGARQTSLSLDDPRERARIAPTGLKPRPDALPDLLTADEKAAHARFIATLGDGSVWRLYTHLLEETGPPD